MAEGSPTPFSGMGTCRDDEGKREGDQIPSAALYDWGGGEELACAMARDGPVPPATAAASAAALLAAAAPAPSPRAKSALERWPAASSPRKASSGRSVGAATGACDGGQGRAFEALPHLQTSPHRRLRRGGAGGRHVSQLRLHLRQVVQRRGGKRLGRRLELLQRRGRQGGSGSDASSWSFSVAGEPPGAASPPPHPGPVWLPRRRPRHRRSGDRRGDRMPP